MSKKINQIMSFALTTVTVVTILLFSINTNPIVKAINYDDQIALCWDNVTSSLVNLGFSSTNKIEGTVRIIGKSGTKYKNGTIKIDRYTGSKWVNVKTWSNLSGSSAVYSFSTTTLTASSNTKYRLTVEITAYNGSSSEVISQSKTSTNS